MSIHFRETVLFGQAVFGGGCFWCLEAVFRELEGVERVTCGYSGGDPEKATYEQVCTGTTGHAEVVQVSFNPEKISYEKLLEVFFRIHDPTTRDRQGNDVGPQYRSVIFFSSESQRQVAEQLKRELDASGQFEAPIVTEIAPLNRFHPAEEEHQRYFERNPEQAYCQAVIQPKLEKLRRAFAGKLKKSAEE
jgi:peptide-methionine (S)-S-oxide reductase